MNKTTIATLSALALAIGATLLLQSDSTISTTVIQNPVLLHIVWTNNYEDSRPNEYSIVISTTNLAIPVESWTPVFATRSGEARIPETNSPSFFAVFNYDPDTGEMSDLGGK